MEATVDHVGGDDDQKSSEDNSNTSFQDDGDDEVTPPRPYNHLINEQADTNLFNKTFHGADDIDSVEQQQQSKQESCSSVVEKSRTGLVYYDGCIDHYCLWDETYEENPQRYTRIWNRFKELDLIDRCQPIKPRKATQNELLLVHTEEYLNKIATISDIIDPQRLEEESSKYDAVYFNPSSYNAALYAAGNTIQLVDSVMQREILNGFALVRPPGHHAMAAEACGYCIFNNVAIATSYCLEKYKLDRILIVDWDVHHGQATQQKFYNDKRVLYASIHRYEKGSFWPELIESNYNFIGENDARGYNLNLPLNDVGMRDTDYLALWYNVLLPVFYEFNPQLVIVSAGFDAAIGCPQGEMMLTPNFYAHLTHSLMALANGQLCVVLEGGYCVESLADSAAFTLRTLLGDAPIPFKITYPLRPSLIDSVLDLISVLRPYWKFLRLQNTFNRHDNDNKNKNNDDDECDSEVVVESKRKRYYPMIEYLGTLEFLPEKPQVYPTRDVCPVQEEQVRAKYAQVIEILRNHNENQYVRYKPDQCTCLIRMSDLSRKHSCAHTHPERPNRINFLWTFLKTNGILQRCHVISDNERLVTEQELLECHSAQDIESIRCTQSMHYKELREYENQFDSIYMTNGTFQAAQLAAGSLLQTVDCVMSGQCLNGFACIRPPGHHASKEKPAGFCFFNNIAIAAKYALKKYHLNRVLIVDWDVHHGDGTQSIVINDERILFVSLHRYDNADFYPEKIESNFNINKNIINIPWNGGPMGDKEYLASFFNVVMPVAYNFSPDLVFISAGFDAAQGDPLGEYQVSPQAYAHMTHMLSSLAKGKIIMALEGGYNLRSIADSAIECIKVLLGDAPGSLNLEGELNQCAVDTLKNVTDYHSTNWPCFAFNVDIPESNI